MVIQAYVDDSISTGDDPYFVLAGFVSTHEQWAEFSDEWEIAIKKPPGIAYFKMTEAMNLQGQFRPERGWNDANRDELLATLAQIIVKYAKVRISTSVRSNEWKRLIGSLPAVSRSLATDNPYITLANQLVSLVSVFSYRHGIDEPCDFYFDEQVGFDIELMYWWPSIRLSAAERPDIAARFGAPPTFRDEKTLLPLQGADMYAWLVRKNKINNRHLVWPPHFALKTISQLPEINREYTPQQMKKDRLHLIQVREDLLKRAPETQLWERSDDRLERRKARKQTQKTRQEASSPRLKK